MDDFVSVLDDMPQNDKHYKNLSIEVDCLLKDSSVVRGFYDNREDIWYYCDSNNKIKKLRGEVVAWRSL